MCSVHGFEIARSNGSHVLDRKTGKRTHEVDEEQRINPTGKTSSEPSDGDGTHEADAETASHSRVGSTSMIESEKNPRLDNSTASQKEDHEPTTCHFTDWCEFSVFKQRAQMRHAENKIRATNTVPIMDFDQTLTTDRAKDPDNNVAIMVAANSITGSNSVYPGNPHPFHRESAVV